MGKKDEKAKKVKTRRRRGSSHWKRVDGSGGRRQWRRSGGRKASETYNKRCQMRVKKEGFVVDLGEIWRREYIVLLLWGRPEGKRKAWGEWENAAQAGSWKKGRDAVGGGSPEFDDRLDGMP